jgi:ABC-type antimicrobial peptide transport system permease subunit
MNVDRELPQNGFTLSVRSISADYLDTIGIRVVAGRDFSDSDTGSSESVGILNESAAALVFPGRAAPGERITYFQGTEVVRIVGIVPDYKHTRLDADAAPQLYTPAQQSPASLGSGAFMVRVRDGGDRQIGALEEIVTAMEPAASVQIESAGEARWNMFSTERFRSGLLLAFASTALGLATIGIFGVVAYTVTVRKREVGIRIALGARHGPITSLMLRQLLLPATAGLAAGLVAAIGLTRFLESFLFEITPTDPLTYAAAVACLLLTSLAASLIPALRATRIDPLTVLRHE